MIRENKLHGSEIHEKLSVDECLERREVYKLSIDNFSLNICIYGALWYYRYVSMILVLHGSRAYVS